MILGSLMMVIGVAVSGCAINSGNSSITKKENVKKIIVYKSTQAQVRQILGEPGSVMVLDGGKEGWTYSHTGGNYSHIYSKDAYKQRLSKYGLFGGLGGGVNTVNTRSTILTLKFNKKGILISKKYGY